MHSGVTISVVIPAYNEEKGIAEVIDMIPGYVDEIVVADNNSKDRTAEIAREKGAVVVHVVEQGYGCAHRGGYPAATKDVIVTMDADGTYPADQIDQVVETLQRENLDFVTCSRFPLKNKDAMSSRNQFGNQILNFFFWLFIGKWLKDSQSGMWCFRRRVLPLLHLEGRTWEFSSEIKIEACTNRHIHFREIHIDFHPRIGFSHFHNWKAAIKVGLLDIGFLFRQRFVRRRSRQQRAYDRLSEMDRLALREYPPINRQELQQG